MLPRFRVRYSVLCSLKCERQEATGRASVSCWLQSCGEHAHAHAHAQTPLPPATAQERQGTG